MDYITQMSDEIRLAETTEDIQRIIEEQLNSDQKTIKEIIELFKKEIDEENNEERHEYKISLEDILQVLKSHLQSEEKAEEILPARTINSKKSRIIWASQNDDKIYCENDFESQRNEIRRENYRAFWKLLKDFVEVRECKFKPSDKLVDKFKGVYKIKPKAANKKERIYAYCIGDAVFIIGAYYKKRNDGFENWLTGRISAVKDEYERLKKELNSPEAIEARLAEEKEIFERIEKLLNPFTSKKEKEDQMKTQEKEKEEYIEEETSLLREWREKRVESNKEDTSEDNESYDDRIIRLLKLYYDENGHLEIPIDYEIVDPKNGEKYALGRWVVRARTRKLKDSQIKKIIEITSYITWINPADIERVKLLTTEELLKPQEEIEILDLNERYIETEAQETNDKKPKKKRKTSDRWYQIFDHVQRIYNYLGHSMIPIGYRIEHPDNIDLGKWLQNQKSAYKKGSLNQDYIEKLEPVEIIWESKSIEARKRKEQFIESKNIEDVKLIDGEIVTTYKDGSTKSTEDTKNYKKESKEETNETAPETFIVLDNPAPTQENKEIEENIVPEINEGDESIYENNEKEEPLTEELLDKIENKIKVQEAENTRKKELVERAETLILRLMELRDEEKKLNEQINSIMTQFKEMGGEDAKGTTL